MISDALSFPLSSSNIQSMTKSLETQFGALLEIQGWLKLKQLPLK